MSEPEAVDTTSVRIVPDEAEPYRRLHPGPGEGYGLRADLLGGVGVVAGFSSVATTPGSGGFSFALPPAYGIAGLIQFTDFQLADLASPARTEYLQRLEGVPDWQRMLPAYRPQEFLLAHAIESMVRTINSLVAARPGQWTVALTTGDNLDSSQRNELGSFLTHLDGGTVEPARGTRGFADAPVGLGDPHYYNPEPESHDRWKRDRGLPDHPGALAAASRPFRADGLSVPWLSCFGNHDCLVQGRAAVPAGYDDYLTGDRKPVSEDLALAPAGDKMEAYVADPRWVGAGEQHAIVADQGRAVVDKAGYVAAHRAAPGLPRGHGFGERNEREGTAYYSYDEIPGVRVIVLDTTNPAGHVDGCLDDAQFRWLEERLAEVSSTRLVVLASHHGLSTLTNDFGNGDDRGPLHLADEVEAMLHRFPQVVLWLSGHTHVNRITPRPGPTPLSGFWEVSTASISEWPVQFRCVELRLARLPEGEDGACPGGLVTIRTTMVDTGAPAAPDGSLSIDDLASLHREIAANDAGSVGGLFAEGTPEDRNQDLLVLVPADVEEAVRTRGARPREQQEVIGHDLAVRLRDDELGWLDADAE